VTKVTNLLFISWVGNVTGALTREEENKRSSIFLLKHLYLMTNNMHYESSKVVGCANKGI